MFSEIENKDKLYLRILDQFQELIIAGKLKPGHKLPPERQLAEQLGVSRPALKQALSILEALHIVDCRQGNGNYILPFGGNLFNPIIMGFYTNKGDFDDILEFRFIIEVQIIKLVTLKATEEQIQELDEIVAQMENFQSLETRVELNNRFHYTLIKLSGNPLVTAIYDSIITLIGEQIHTTKGENFRDYHQKIIDGIRSKNPETAASYMIEHFTSKFPNYEYYHKL